jgi:hypothetical protein
VGLEATLCGSRDNQETQVLFPGSFYTCRIRSTIGACSPKQRSNMADCIVGSGNWPI